MIHKLDLNEFTVFKKASLEFGNRINVLIGENGSGKTQILKFLYATLNILPIYQKDGIYYWKQVVKDTIPAPKTGVVNKLTEKSDLERFKSVFKVDIVADLVNQDYRNKKTKRTHQERMKAIDGTDFDVIHEDVSGVRSENSVFFSVDGKDYEYNIELCYLDVIAGNLIASKKEAPDPIPVGFLPECLFLPTRELLTIFPHYLSLLRMYKLPYDSTYDDGITKLGLPPSNQYAEEFISIIKDLEKAIEGTIFLKNDKFYYRPYSAKEDQDIDINMTAEGWRKLGMLLQLIKTGGLHKGVVLLWDEPEANLNPKLISLVAKVLIKLSKLDIQVFITTHSLFLLREIDMLSKEKGTYEQGDIRYFNFLGKGKVEQGNAPEDLNNILLLDESLKQSDRYLEMED